MASREFIEFARQFRRYDREVDLSDIIFELFKTDSNLINLLAREKLLSEKIVLSYLDLYKDDQKVLDSLAPSTLNPTGSLTDPLPIIIQNK